MASSTEPEGVEESLGRPFEALLFTNFSDTCFRILPAMAQWCDTFVTRLTIVHAYDPRHGSHHAAEARLSSYFPEADRYAFGRRRVVAGTPADALRSLAAEGPIDLVIAPSGEPLGLPRLTPRSVRASLLQEQVAPLWTIGAGPRASRLGLPHRQVAACVLAGEEGHANVVLARQYAAAIGAEFHVIFLTPLWSRLPASFSGTAGREDMPTAPHLLPLEAASVKVARHWNLVASIDDVQADIVFVDAARWTRRRYWSRRTRHALDRLQRPIVCVSNARGPVAWPLTTARK
jgi:hypothetical protein